MRRIWLVLALVALTTALFVTPALGDCTWGCEGGWSITPDTEGI